MRIAYLINQYPKTSHAFIRREIAALESRGIIVDRMSIRRVKETLVEPEDRAEQSRTTTLLDRGLLKLAFATLAVFISCPIKSLRCLLGAIRLAKHSDRGFLRHLAYVAEACLLKRLTAASKASHIHAHFGTNSAAVAMLCHLLDGPSYSFTVHGPEEFDRPDALHLGDKIHHASFVVAVSEFGHSQLMRWCKMSDWPRIHVIRCGVDRSYLAVPLERPATAPRLVCVGRLCEQKGQLLLVQAARLLADDGINFELVLAGDGPLRAEIENAINDRGLAGRVRITGWLSGEQVKNEIQHARALVLPSFAEGLPVVIMEALALGRPVLSTYVAGIPELVIPGDNGLLVPAGNVEMLAGAMKTILQISPTDLVAMGTRGRQRVVESHDCLKEAEKLARLFRGQASEAAPSEIEPSETPAAEPVTTVLIHD